MKVYIIGSTSAMHEMVTVYHLLADYGHIAGIGEDYLKLAAGQMNDDIRRTNGEAAAIKRERDYLRYHYARILEHDAVLVVNTTRDGRPNYIGGNVLIEMGQAYVNGKMIFLLYDLPWDDQVPGYRDEIEAMDPICLGGDLKCIATY